MWMPPLFINIQMDQTLQTRIKNVLMEQQLVRKPAGMGLTMLHNNDIMIAGGMRSGNSPAGMTRLKYVIYDMLVVKELVAGGMDRNDAYDQSKAGEIQLFVWDGTDSEIHGISDIKITQKKAGVDRRVVEALIADCASQNKPLYVYDIQKKAMGFWDKMGCKFYNSGKRVPDSEPLSLVDAKKRDRVLMGIVNPQFVSDQEEPKPIKLTGFKRQH
jgi:hypothetical protein